MVTVPTMEVLGTYKFQGPGFVAVLRRTECPNEVRQGDRVEGSDGRRWVIRGVLPGTAVVGKSYNEPIIGLMLEGRGEPKVGKPLVLVNEGSGDAVWISAEQARAMLHILRTVRIWVKHEACDPKSEGLQKLPMHARHFEESLVDGLMNQLRVIGYGTPKPSKKPLS
jgi:hypothetical protein